MLVSIEQGMNGMPIIQMNLQRSRWLGSVLGLMVWIRVSWKHCDFGGLK